MKPFLAKVFVVGCLVAVAGFAWTVADGQEGKKKKKKGPTDDIKARLAAAELPPDVLEKANKIVEEHAPKLREAQAKIDEVNAALTPDQRRARTQAQKAAREDGKTQQEAQAAGLAAAKLSDEQKKKLEEGQQAFQAAYQAMTRDLRTLLTPEQREKVLKKKKAN